MSHLVLACIVCQRPTVMNCERCRRVWYCSSECQRYHWPMHHASCAPTPTDTPSSSTPPSPVDVQCFKALVLFAQSTARHWRMIEVHIPILPVAGGPRLIPQFGPELDLGGRPGYEICLNDVGGSPLRHPYQIFFRSSFREDGSPINHGVRNFHPDITYPWAGNIVVLKFDGSRRQRYTHMEPSDLPQVAQFFRTYPN